MRERMAEHRDNPACAAATADGSDRLRARELRRGRRLANVRETARRSTHPADLPDGSKFAGVAGLRQARCSSRPEVFVGTVTEKLLTYALGRGVGAYDAPAVREIVRDAARRTTASRPSSSESSTARRFK